ncbi:hypothetical protein M405DRAFT_807841, partial [Rhizopogon salebrosus TDB-379]
MKGDDWMACRSWHMYTEATQQSKVAQTVPPEHETIRYKAVHRREGLPSGKLLSRSPLHVFQLRARNTR